MWGIQRPSPLWIEWLRMMSSNKSKDAVTLRLQNQQGRESPQLAAISKRHSSIVTGDAQFELR
jgi:hypothetical protein